MEHRRFAWGWAAGRALRGLSVLVLIAIILWVLYIAAFLLFIYPQTATVVLENKSDGTAMFFVDNNIACRDVHSGQYCTVAIRTYRSHQFYATDYYGAEQFYFTPRQTLSAKTGERYEYLACGQTGTPGENCGLFGLDTIPNTY